MKIAPRTVVTIDYTLKNPSGEVVDSSEGGDPLAYLHGTGQIVEGLERALEGLDVGDVRDVVVAPADGYGVADPEGVFGVPRAAFPPDIDLKVGDALVGEDEEGTAVPVRVVELRGEEVLVDANHPLAGVELHFHVTVRDVRDATLEELTHGHPHGADGHDHDHDHDHDHGGSPSPGKLIV